MVIIFFEFMKKFLAISYTVFEVSSVLNIFQIPSSWKNPSGEFYVGVKSAYSLYPKKLRERIEQSRKKKFWDDGNQKALVEATRALQVS